MRAFDLLAKTEQDIRAASHPRYHFEMMLLRWMHVRKLVPLAELMEQLGGSTPPRTLQPPARTQTNAVGRPMPSAPPAREPRPVPTASTAPAAPGSGPASAARSAPTSGATAAPARQARSAPTSEAPSAPTSAAGLKDAFLAEIRGAKGFFYNTVVAQAQKIEMGDDRVVFSFLPTHRALREQFEQSRAWLEPLAERVAGRKLSVVAVQADVPAAPAPAAQDTASSKPASGGKRDLKSEAMESPAVQAVLDVFPAEIRDVEEIDR